MKIEGVYSFKAGFLAVEASFDCSPDEIDWFGFVVPEEGKDEEELEAAYMEQFLNEDGTEKLCEAWEEPEDCENMTYTRTVFFIKSGHGNILSTPYGDVDISAPSAMPKRLSSIIEFEKP